MKLIFIMMLAGCLQISAAAFSQNISLKRKNASLETVFKSIEKQTTYNFFYKIELIDRLKKITLDVKDQPVEKILEMILKDQPVDYKIIDHVIIISSKEASGTSISIPVNVKGTVTDDKGGALPGVTITIKDGKTSTVTDGSGKFMITADDHATLPIYFHRL